MNTANQDTRVEHEGLEPPAAKRTKFTTTPSPANVEHVHGDLLKFEADVLVQQTNCITCRSTGLAEKLRNKFPYADAYGRRKPHTPSVATKSDQDIPGTVRVLGPTDKQIGPYVACLFAQYRPGKSNLQDRKYRIPECNAYDDTPELRLEWFDSGLSHLSKWLDQHPECTRIAFPYKIGCGLAGGNWDDYMSRIAEFATLLHDRKLFIVCNE